MNSREGAGFTPTDGLMLCTTTIWAVNFSVTKFATTVFEPRAFAGLRVSLAAVALLGLAFVRRAPLPRGRDLLSILALGVVGHSVYQLLFIEGLTRTRAGNAALIVAATPAFIAAASNWRGIERIRGRTVIGLALSFVGVAAIILGSATAQAGSSSLAGTLLIFCGVLCWTVFTMGVQHFSARTNVLSLAGLTIAGGVFPLLLHGGPALSVMRWETVTPLMWLGLLYSSLAAMVIAYLFWFRGVRVLGPTRTAAYANIQPVIALLFAWITLGEIPTLWQGLGTATIVTGVFFTRT